MEVIYLVLVLNKDFNPFPEISEIDFDLIFSYI